MKIFLPRSRRLFAAVAVLLVFAVAAFASFTSIFVVNGVIEPTSDAIGVPDVPPIIGNVVVSIREATFSPGGATLWHYHPGPTYAVVKSGTFTEDRGCGNIDTYSAGQAFFDAPGEIVQGRNEGSDPVDLYWTVVAPQDKPFNTVVSGPVCHP